MTYDGAVTLSAAELLVLMRYQQVLDTTVNWSYKASVHTACSGDLRCRQGLRYAALHGC